MRGWGGLGADNKLLHCIVRGLLGCQQHLVVGLLRLGQHEDPSVVLRRENDLTLRDLALRSYQDLSPRVGGLHDNLTVTNGLLGDEHMLRASRLVLRQDYLPGVSSSLRSKDKLVTTSGL